MIKIGNFDITMIFSECVLVLIKQHNRLRSNPRPNVISYITREPEVNATEHPAVTVFERRHRQVRDAPCDYSNDIDRHVAARRQISPVAAPVQRLLMAAAAARR